MYLQVRSGGGGGVGVGDGTDTFPLNNIKFV